MIFNKFTTIEIDKNGLAHFYCLKCKKHFSLGGTKNHIKRVLYWHSLIHIWKKKKYENKNIL